MGTKGTPTTVGDVEGLIRSWMRHLRAAHLSANTITNCRCAAEQFHAHLIEAGMPTWTSTWARLTCSAKAVVSARCRAA
ncbi:MAG: hypothetical protein ACRD0K_14575 [Egibacteraceae bacterium]